MRSGKKERFVNCAFIKITALFEEKKGNKGIRKRIGGVSLGLVGYLPALGKFYWTPVGLPLDGARNASIGKFFVYLKAPGSPSSSESSPAVSWFDWAHSILRVTGTYPSCSISKGGTHVNIGLKTCGGGIFKRISDRFGPGKRPQLLLPAHPPGSQFGRGGSGEGTP